VGRCLFPEPTLHCNKKFCVLFFKCRADLKDIHIIFFVNIYSMCLCIYIYIYIYNFILACFYEVESLWTSSEEFIVLLLVCLLDFRYFFFLIESEKTFNMCISLLEIVSLQGISNQFLFVFLDIIYLSDITGIFFFHLILPASQYTLPISLQTLGRYQNWCAKPFLCCLSLLSSVNHQPVIAN
jgi:hypothetical protein